MMSVVDVMFDPNNGLKVTERPKALADRMVGLWEMISEVSENLPPATLRWRIQNWLAVGQGRVERGLGDMKVRAFGAVSCSCGAHGSLGNVEGLRVGKGPAVACCCFVLFCLSLRKEPVPISPPSHQLLLGTGK